MVIISIIIVNDVTIYLSGWIKGFYILLVLSKEINRHRKKGINISISICGYMAFLRLARIQ